MLNSASLYSPIAVNQYVVTVLVLICLMIILGLAYSFVISTLLPILSPFGSWSLFSRSLML